MPREEREAEYKARGWWADDTLARWLARHVRERPDAPALAFQDLVLSWRDLERRILDCAGLRRARRRPGDVALQLPNTPEFVLSYLAIARLGAVTCPLHMPPPARGDTGADAPQRRAPRHLHASVKQISRAADRF
jgi:acyl-CoA synthetase (AMP-forming)/AMP-acid ligase II